MIAEVSLPLEYTNIVSVEVDSEKEHEEGKEENKEKTSEVGSFSIPKNESSLLNMRLAINSDLNWNSPSIDFQTPPPELS